MTPLDEHKKNKPSDAETIEENGGRTSWLIAGNVAPVIGVAAEPLFQVVKVAAAGVSQVENQASVIRGKIEDAIGEAQLEDAEKQLAEKLQDLEPLVTLFKSVRTIAESDDDARTFKWDTGEFSKSLNPGLPEITLTMKADAKISFIVDATDTAKPDDIPGTSFHLSASGKISVGAEAEAAFRVLAASGNVSFAYSESVDYGFRVNAQQDKGVPMLLAITAGLTHIDFDVASFDETREALGDDDGYVALETITLERKLDFNAGAKLGVKVPFNVAGVNTSFTVSIANGHELTLKIREQQLLNSTALLVDVDAKQQKEKIAGFTFGLSVGIAALGEDVIDAIKKALKEFGAGLDEVEELVNQSAALEERINLLLPGQYFEKTLLKKIEADTDFKSIFATLLGKDESWSVTDLSDDIKGFASDIVDDFLGLFGGGAITGADSLAEKIKAELLERVGAESDARLGKLDDLLSETHKEAMDAIKAKLDDLTEDKKEDLKKLLRLDDIRNIEKKLLGVIEDVRSQLKKVSTFVSDSASELLSVQIARETKNQSLLTALAQFRFSEEVKAATGASFEAVATARATQLQAASTQYGNLVGKPLKTLNHWVDPSLATLPNGVEFLSGSLKRVRKRTTTGSAAIGFLGLNFSSKKIKSTSIGVERFPDGSVRMGATSKLQNTLSNWKGTRIFDIDAAATFAKGKAANEPTDGMTFRILSREEGKKDEGDITSSDITDYLERLVAIDFVPPQRASAMAAHADAELENTGKHGYEFEVVLDFDEASADAFCKAANTQRDLAVYMARRALLEHHTTLDVYMQVLAGEDWRSMTEEEQDDAFMNVSWNELRKLGETLAMSPAKQGAIRGHFRKLQEYPAHWADGFGALGKLLVTPDLDDEQVEDIVGDFTDGLSPWCKPTPGGTDRASDMTVAFFEAMISFAGEVQGVTLPVSLLKYRQKKDGPATLF